MLRCCLCFGAGLVSVGTRLWFFENADYQPFRDC